MKGRQSPITDEQIRKALKETNGNASKAAKLVGLSQGQMRLRRRQVYQSLGSDSPSVTPPESNELIFPPSVDSKLPIDELISRRIAEFDRVRTAAELGRVTNVQVQHDLPIAVVVFGDPHLDDPGTDLRLLKQHSDIVNATPGMYAGCIGDLHNNWVGRIAHLYAQQETTAGQSWDLVEWWINYVNSWLFMVDGNHDAWSGNGNPLQWIRSLAGRRMVQDDHEARINLKFANGFEYLIAARHNWPGNSQWNPAHGEFKAALMRLKADLIVSGHTHTSLDSSLYVEAHDIVTRCAKVGSYKVFDRYATELGLARKQIAPSFAVVIDPRAKTLTQRSQLFYDIERAASYLTFLRQEYTDVQPGIYPSEEFHAEREGGGWSLHGSGGSGQLDWRREGSGRAVRHEVRNQC